MPAYNVATAEGATRKVEGRKFAAYIKNIRYWFLVHQEAGRTILSDFESGYRIDDVPHLTLVAARGDIVLAAKAHLAAFVKQRGEDRVKDVLDHAPKLQAAG